MAGTLTDDSRHSSRGALVVRTPRTRIAERRYVLDVVLSEWLGLEYELEFEDRTTVSIRLAGDTRGRGLTLPDLLFATPDADWLTQRSMPVLPLAQYVTPPIGAAGSDEPRGAEEAHFRATPIPVIFGVPAVDDGAQRWAAGGVALDIDIFGSIFYLLTRYEEIAQPAADRHGRYPAGASLAAGAGFLDRPIVDEYVDLLWMAIHFLWPKLEPPSPRFRLRLTHDVDDAWATHGRGVGAIAHALVGDVFNRRDPNLAVRRLRSALDGPTGRVDHDPFNTYDFLMDVSERHDLRSTFYFMAGVSDPIYDGRYSLTDPRLGSVLRRIHDRGHEVGLHASYGSHLSAERMRTELETLESACRDAGFDQPTWGVRQHFLRFENPQTWRSQESAGLEHDSTLGFAERIGFRAGTGREFPVFDLLAGRRLRLRERPLVVMDGTLLEYMGLDLDQAAAQTRAIVQTCRPQGGEATLLYHNHTVAGRRPAAHYRDLVARLASRPSAGS